MILANASWTHLARRLQPLLVALLAVAAELAGGGRTQWQRC
jgi:hypothetical protein